MDNQSFPFDESSHDLPFLTFTVSFPRRLDATTFPIIPRRLTCIRPPCAERRAQIIVTRQFWRDRCVRLLVSHLIDYLIPGLRLVASGSLNIFPLIATTVGISRQLGTRSSKIMQALGFTLRKWTVSSMVASLIPWSF